MNDDTPGNRDRLDRLVRQAAAFPTDETRLLAGVRRRISARGVARPPFRLFPDLPPFAPGLVLASALAVTPFAVAHLPLGDDPTLAVLSAIALGDPFAAGDPTTGAGGT
ncbi:MAG: hypothetical protein ACKVPY_07295 [Paracoccaceae bacterium]